MSNIINIGSNSITKIHHATAIDDKTYMQTTYYDDAALDQNSRIRSAGLLHKKKLGLHENEDIRMAISIPSIEQYNLWKRDYPESYTLIKSKSEDERMKGAKQLQLIHPDWVVMERL